MGEQKTALTLLLILCSLLVALPIIDTVKAAEESWITLEPMPTAERGLGAAVVNGRIYAIGSNVNYEYDPATDTWRKRKDISVSEDLNRLISICDRL